MYRTVRTYQCHSPHSAKQDAPSPNSINKHEVDPGEKEVSSCDDSSNSYGIGKADKSEKRGRVIHERIETSELTDCHETAGSNKCSKVAGDDIKLFEEPDISSPLLQSFSFSNVSCDVLNFLLDLLRSSLWENLLDDNCSFIRLIMVNELTGALWAERQKTAENNRRNCA